MQRLNQAGVARWRFDDKARAVTKGYIAALSEGRIGEELGEMRAGVFESKAWWMDVICSVRLVC